MRGEICGIKQFGFGDEISFRLGFNMKYVYGRCTRHGFVLHCAGVME